MTEARPIRVLIVDDHAVVRQGLVTFLYAFDDLVLAGEAANGHEAIERCAAADVVLMDMLMPEMDGATATRVIVQRYPHVKVLALTSFHDDDMVQHALHAGAIGYLLKNVSADELAAAIRAAHAGRHTLAPEATQALINAATRPAAPGHDLTARERDVLALLVKGLSNTEIATHLIVGHSTVKGHVSNILAKLGVTSRTEAVALAVAHRIVR